MDRLRRFDVKRIAQTFDLRLRTGIGRIHKRIEVDLRTRIMGFNLHGSARFTNRFTPVYSGSVSRTLGPFGMRVYLQTVNGQVKPNLSFFVRSGRFNFSTFYRPIQDQGNVLVRFDLYQGGFVGLSGRYQNQEFEGEIEFNFPIRIKFYRTKRIKGKDRTSEIILSPVKVIK